MRENQETNEPCLYDLSRGERLIASRQHDRLITRVCSFNFLGVETKESLLNEYC